MKRSAAILLVLAVSACAGASTRPLPLASNAAASGAHTGATTTTLQISIPHAPSAASTNRRSPAYVSASTQSMTVDVKPHLSGTSVSGFPITANLTASSAGCSSTITATVCDLSLTLGPGSYDATLTTFDGTGGSGNQLSAAQSMPLTVVEGQANTVPIALGGIPASVQILATGGQVVAAQGFVFTLPASTSGALTAYGVDADGNTIVGAGAPAISAATDNAASIAVTQPTATAANAVGVTSQGAASIAHVTVTVTPVAGTGTSAISRTITVQAPTLPLLYVADNGVRVFDMTGTEVTRPGTAFAGFTLGTGLAYNTNNGLLYAAVQSSPGYILAFDKNGTAQPLSASATNLGVITGLAFDPQNGYVYAGGESVAFDANGNTIALNSTISPSYAVTYDSKDQLVLSGAIQYSPAGTSGASLPFTPQVNSETFNPYNNLIYVASVYPNAVTAYNTAGVAQSLTGTFTLSIGGDPGQIGGITADPVTGNIFLSTNGNNTYGFDRNGNPLPAPWHDIVGTGAASGAAGLAVVPPQ